MTSKLVEHIPMSSHFFGTLKINIRDSFSDNLSNGHGKVISEGNAASLFEMHHLFCLEYTGELHICYVGSHLCQAREEGNQNRGSRGRDQQLHSQCQLRR
jgi:hypothetical protein